MSELLEGLPEEVDGSGAVEEIRAAISSGNAPRVVVRSSASKLSSLQTVASNCPASDPTILSDNSRLTTLVLDSQVLDDDPTGTQTVHGIRVLTEWSIPSLQAELQGDAHGFFILVRRTLTRDSAGFREGSAPARVLPLRHSPVTHGCPAAPRPDQHPSHDGRQGLGESEGDLLQSESRLQWDAVHGRSEARR